MSTIKLTTDREGCLNGPVVTAAGTALVDASGNVETSPEIAMMLLDSKAFKIADGASSDALKEFKSKIVILDGNIPYSPGEQVKVFCIALAGQKILASDGMEVQFDLGGNSVCGRNTANALKSVFDKTYEKRRLTFTIEEPEQAVKPYNPGEERRALEKAAGIPAEPIAPVTEADKPADYVPAVDEDELQAALDRAAAVEKAIAEKKMQEEIALAKAKAEAEVRDGLKEAQLAKKAAEAEKLAQKAAEVSNKAKAKVKAVKGGSDAGK